MLLHLTLEEGSSWLHISNGQGYKISYDYSSAHVDFKDSGKVSIPGSTQNYEYVLLRA